MAESNDKSNVERLAFQLFTERSGRAGRDAGHIAIGCFKDAERFQEIAGKYKAGTIDVSSPTGPQLSDASAPNLVKVCKNHPHNLVSKRFGDLKKVAKVYQWLKQNPAPRDLNQEDRCEIDSLGISWDGPTTKLARMLLPEYVAVEEREPALAPA